MTPTKGTDMTRRAGIAVKLAMGGAALGLVLGAGVAPAAAEIVGPQPSSSTFNDNACIIQEGYNISKIINGVKWSLYGVKSFPGQICYTALWVRRG
jgi:hypothetical protein